MKNGMNTNVLNQTVNHAMNWLDSLQDGPVGPRADTSTLRANLGGPLPESGTLSETVIDDLVSAVEGGLMRSPGPRFFAWVTGGTLEASLAADWLTSTWDQNAALPDHSPAAAIVEEVTGTWLKELLGLPPRTSFAFTTGCQMAHFTCLSAARHAVLQKEGWEVNSQGMFGAPPVTVIVNSRRHTTIDRALRFLGFGLNAILPAPVNDDDRIDPQQFQMLMNRMNGPVIVCLNAGDLNIGTFDLFETIIPMAKEHGAWVHIDGAFGLIARASRKFASRMAGLELADSWAADGHKWLNLPYDCGFAFVRDAEAHRIGMTVNAAYVSNDAKIRNQMDWNPEFSRRARGFAAYAALRQLGRKGVEELINRTCAMAVRLVSGLGKLPGVEVLRMPTLNQGLVRFPSPSPSATPDDSDCRTRSIIEAINATGEAFFSGSVWRGMQVMRVSVVNWKTSEADVDRVIAAVAAVLRTDNREDIG